MPLRSMSDKKSQHTSKSNYLQQNLLENCFTRERGKRNFKTPRTEQKREVSVTERH